MRRDAPQLGTLPIKMKLALLWRKQSLGYTYCINEIFNMFQASKHPWSWIFTLLDLECGTAWIIWSNSLLFYECGNGGRGGELLVRLSNRLLQVPSPTLHPIHIHYSHLFKKIPKLPPGGKKLPSSCLWTNKGNQAVFILLNKLLANDISLEKQSINFRRRFLS